VPIHPHQKYRPSKANDKSQKFDMSPADHHSIVTAYRWVTYFCLGTLDGIRLTLIDPGTGDNIVRLPGSLCWHGIWPDGLCGFRPKAAGMRPVACGPMPRSRSSPGSDARHRSLDVILGFAEYARFPIYICLSFSLFAL
jgi:hypothetical protein